jgi:hypothetical protein
LQFKMKITTYSDSVLLLHRNKYPCQHIKKPTHNIKHVQARLWFFKCFLYLTCFHKTIKYQKNFTFIFMS